MSMHVNLSSDMESFVKRLIENGSYGDATAVVSVALERMRDEEARIAAFQAAIRVGDEEIERGEVFEYTRDSMKEMAAEARAQLHSSEPIDRDVLP